MHILILTDVVDRGLWYLGVLSAAMSPTEEFDASSQTRAKELSKYFVPKGFGSLNKLIIHWIIRKLL
jgi:hypothetical protein